MQMPVAINFLMHVQYPVDPALIMLAFLSCFLECLCMSWHLVCAAACCICLWASSSLIDAAWHFQSAKPQLFGRKQAVQVSCTELNDMQPQLLIIQTAFCLQASV